MSLMIGAVVIVIIVAGAAFFMSGKSGAKNTTQSETQQKKESAAAVVQEKKKNEIKEEAAQGNRVNPNEETKVAQERRLDKRGEVDRTQQKTAPASKQYANTEEYKNDTESVFDNNNKKTIEEVTEKRTSENQEKKSVEKANFKEKNRQKEQLYYYINHALQTLYIAYNKGEWDDIQTLGEISPALYEEKEAIIEGLPSFTGAMVKEYFSCVDFREEGDKIVTYVKDKEQLKKAFLQFMMPFYPYYYKQLSEGGLRHTALLQPNTLRLFQQLTGKKFRPGYRNRYSTGVRAFEWDKNRYRVYGKDGKLLCDAVFGTDGIIYGYGQKKYTDETHPDWNIVEEGNWKDGTFESGILRYEYRKPVE